MSRFDHYFQMNVDDVIDVYKRQLVGGASLKPDFGKIVNYNK